jgi:glucose/arabinose dehydrogenase
MKTMLSGSRTVLLAALAAGLVAAGPLAAQQPAVNQSPPTQPPVQPAAQPSAGSGSQPLVSSPAPARQAQTPTAPPPWAQGRPEGEGAVKLAPVPALPIATAPDKLPTTQLKLPEGFNIEVYAAGLTNARSLRVDDQGTVFVSTRVLDRVYAVTNKNGEREVKTVVKGMNSPNGIALQGGALFIAEINKISMIKDVENHLEGDAKPLVIYSDLPSDAPHGWKFLTVGPDNKLYFNVGAPCNVCMPPPTHAQIRRINLDGSGMEVVALGIRQIVGMDWHPASKVLYFTENQRDWLSEEQPNDKLNRLLHPGKDNFGFPYCGGGVTRTASARFKTVVKGMNSPKRHRTSISMIRDVENHLEGDAKPLVIYSDLPGDAPHGWKFLTVGPDNKLYFNVGAPCNVCMPPPTHAQGRPDRRVRSRR